MKKGIVLAVGLIAGLFFLLTGLPQAQAADVVKIGVLGPMTGGAAPVGVDMLRGIKIAAQEVNDRGGVNVGGKKYKVELVDMDDGAVVANAVANARRMVSLHKTPVVIGPPISSCALAVLEFNDKTKKPGTDFLVVTMAMHPKITSSGNQLIVRTNTPSKQMGVQFAGGLIKLKKPKSVAIIYHTDDWGLTWKEGLEETAIKNGVKIVDAEGIDERKQTDFYVQLTKIVNAKPDAVFMIAHDAVTAMMVKQIREIGYKGRLVFSEGFGDDGRKLVPDKLEGCLWPATAIDFNMPSAQRYHKMSAKIYDTPSNKQYGPHAYDQLRFIIAAMEKAQSVTDPYAIRAAFPAITAKPMPNAILKFGQTDGSGHTMVYYLIAEQKGDKVVEATQE